MSKLAVGQISKKGFKKLFLMNRTHSNAQKLAEKYGGHAVGFCDIKEVLDVLREGSTVALINIKPLKEKDLVELKRAVSKLRKTCEAIDGDIAGFGEDYVVAVPYFAKIHRQQSLTKE